MRYSNKRKYKIPFYSYHTKICYINVRKEIVDLGFVNGAKLSNHDGLLEEKGRIRVRTISFKSVAEVDELKIKELVSEALKLDEKGTIN